VREGRVETPDWTAGEWPAMDGWIMPENDGMERMEGGGVDGGVWVCLVKKDAGWIGESGDAKAPEGVLGLFGRLKWLCFEVEGWRGVEEVLGEGAKSSL
jgi:hypothetical protein